MSYHSILVSLSFLHYTCDEGQNSTLFRYFFEALDSRIPPHVLRRRSDRIIRRSKIALMERAHLVRLERTNDSVQHATFMEQDEVLFPPVVRVHQLERNENVAACSSGGRG